ncbi:MAG: DUF805 domain-containing protein [Defluviitaleaceae bacterium]|nr:DUF805 domain-containing protein [Defluviitaleaceae bacterium]
MTFSQCYASAFRNYVNFSGRATRAEYWYFYLANILINTVLSILGLVFIATALSSVLSLLQGVYGLVIIIPGLSLAVRRFHDIGRSGGFYFLISIVTGLLSGIGLTLMIFGGAAAIFGGLGAAFGGGMGAAGAGAGMMLFGVIMSLVSLAMFIYIIVLLATQGQAGPNIYGPDPRAYNPYATGYPQAPQAPQAYNPHDAYNPQAPSYPPAPQFAPPPQPPAASYPPPPPVQPAASYPPPPVQPAAPPAPRPAPQAPPVYDTYSDVFTEQDLAADTVFLSPASTASFALLENGRPTKTIPFTQYPFVIGRQTGTTHHCFSDEDDKFIGKEHITVTNTFDKHYVTDLNSKNGTFINGAKIQPNIPTLINVGDIVKIGKRELKLQI